MVGYRAVISNFSGQVLQIKVLEIGDLSSYLSFFATELRKLFSVWVNISFCYKIVARTFFFLSVVTNIFGAQDTST